MDHKSRHQATGLRSALEDHVMACAGAGRDCTDCPMAAPLRGAMRHACACGDAARLWRVVMDVAPRAMACRHGCAAGIDLLQHLLDVTRAGFGRQLCAAPEAQDTVARQQRPRA